MAQSDRERFEAERRGNIVRLVFNKLGPAFQPADCPAKWGFVFGISERAPVGQRFASGAKYEFKGGPKQQQFDIICSTSADDQEAADRVIQLVIHGNDTTKLAALTRNNFNEQAVKEMVATTVASILKTHVEELMRNKDRVEEIARFATNKTIIDKMEPVTAPVQEAIPSKPVKRGLQEKPPRKSKQEYGAAIDAENKMWEDRAKILGIGPPVIRTRDRHVDGRWVRKAQIAWDQHCKSTPVT